MTTRETPWLDGTPCWADLGAPDIAKAREFYSDVFSWTVQPGGPETGGYSVAELNGRGVANGGSVIREPIDHPYGRMSTVADDQGAVFSLLGVTPG